MEAATDLDLGCQFSKIFHASSKAEAIRLELRRAIRVGHKHGERYAFPSDCFAAMIIDTNSAF
jgi:hypothetical protein